jgi:membrane-associated phospholipid phosphatase
MDLRRSTRSSCGRRSFVAALVGALAVCGATPVASAQTRPGAFELSWFWDGGAGPFLWGAIASRLTIEATLDPPERPRFFAAEVDGEPSHKSHELPGPVVTASGVILGVAIGFDDSEARWFHFKGFAQSMATASLLTGVGKIAFGRRRPDYDPTSSDPDGRRSFPSGHASQALAAASYFGLYMMKHGFDRYRDPGTLPWWEVATYLTIASAAIAVPVERVVNNRHHFTDVMAGSLLGVATSATFFLYQELRFQRSHLRSVEPDSLMPRVTPVIERGVGVTLQWDWR